jgi:alpha-galactosidase
VWVLCDGESSDSELDFATVNGMLGRPQISGPIWSLDDRQLRRLADAIGTYKSIREDLRHGIPFWPLGLAAWEDAWIASGIDVTSHAYLAVWRRGGDETITVDLAFDGARRITAVEPLVPTQVNGSIWVTGDGTKLGVTLRDTTAAVLLRVSLGRLDDEPPPEPKSSNTGDKSPPDV